MSQPTRDTLVITLTGVAAASSQPLTESSAIMKLVLDQGFEIRFADPKIPYAKLAVGVRVNGLLRNGRDAGSAEMTAASATVLCEGNELMSVAIPPKGICGLGKKERRCSHGLAVSSSRGPICVPVHQGKYKIIQVFGVSAQRSKGFLPWRSSVEFAPPPSLPEGWVGNDDPFLGVDKLNFGFQVVLKVSAGETSKQTEGR
ncbi:MAG: hypothetical protein ACFCD0_16745 [Gemmataceae bacterium]